MVIVDAYSKWVEVVLMPSTISEAIVKALRWIFVTHGLPDTIISYNGPQLTSGQFQTFLAKHAIRHALVAPYHPSSNGLAEQAVRSTKDALSKMGSGDWHDKITSYLLARHTTPCPSTLHSPAELLMGWQLRIDLDQ